MSNIEIAGHLPKFDHINSAALWAINACQSGLAAAPRGEPTFETFACSFKLSNPRNRLLSLSNRKWSPALAVGELCWHMAGRDDVDALAYYAPRWSAYSDDGRSVRGSCYGRKMLSDHGGVNAWEVAANFLRDDPDSRRATITIGGYDTSDTTNVKDISCLQTLHFLIRNEKLNLIVHMRSNDAYIGLPYDVFLFSFFMEIMAHDLGYDIGEYIHIADSMHIYERDLASAERLDMRQNSRSMHKIVSRKGLDQLIRFEEDIRTRDIVGLVPETQPWADMALILARFRNKKLAAPP